MTDTPAAAEDDALRFSEVLRNLATQDGDELSINDVICAFGERAFGALMLTVGLLNLLPWPPGGTTIVGAPLLFITVQLAIGQDQLWLPRWVRGASFSRRNFRTGLRRVEPWLGRAERLTKPRLRWAVTGPSERLIGIAALLLTCVLVLPIPGGNFVPALVIVTFALALVQRDGMLALLGWAGVTTAVSILWLVAPRVWEAAQELWGWGLRLLG